MEIVCFGSTMCFLKHLDFIWSFLPVISFPCWDTTGVDHATSQPPTSNKDIERGPKKVIPLIAVCHIRRPSPIQGWSLRGSSDPRTAPIPDSRFPQWAFSFLSCCQCLKWGLGLSWGKEWLTQWADGSSFCFPEIYTEQLHSIITRWRPISPALTLERVGWGGGSACKNLVWSPPGLLPP